MRSNDRSALTARRSWPSMFSASATFLRAPSSLLKVSSAFFTLSTFRCRKTGKQIGRQMLGRRRWLQVEAAGGPNPLAAASVERRSGAGRRVGAAAGNAQGASPLQRPPPPQRVRLPGRTFLGTAAIRFFSTRASSFWMQRCENSGWLSQPLVETCRKGAQQQGWRLAGAVWEAAAVE